MSGQDGAETSPFPQTCSLTTLGRTPGDPDPHQRLKLREETEASQVMAEPGEGSSETVALPPPQLPEERGAFHAPAGCGQTPQIRCGGDRGFVETEAGRAEAPPLTEGLEAGSVSVATDNSLKNGCRSGEPGGPGGEKPPGTCVAERSGSEVLEEVKTSEVETEKCTVFSVAVDEAVEKKGVKEEETVEKEGVKEEEVVEQKMEIEKQVGEEIEMMEENRVVEEVKEDAGLRPLNMDLRMNPLEAIQLELDTVNAQADRAFQQLEQKFGRMRRHYLERRNYIIQNIPGFWVTAFRNHPQLSPMIRGQDAEMLRYITNLEVKELRHPRTGCKFKFFFRRNPYFRNKLIVKEYEVRASGRVVSLSTPIIWRRGHEPQSFIRRNQDVVCNFFTWFSDHSLPESDKIAEIIKEDLWPNPLQYYLLREGVRRARRRPIREPVEIPRPFGFQSG
ncbi:low quality protein: [Lynx pardinus]|uniref:TSPY like 1 n=2 Tax=Lynx TaxID=13124 RepID=A0A667G398_LYNCA|nr:testis-specific Y-encoded-like protein 1 [Lynx canadensis]VFV35835.1 low quality protein: [Lynx pardinus]